jgi:hypothetical protein
MDAIVAEFIESEQDADRLASVIAAEPNFHSELEERYGILG